MAEGTGEPTSPWAFEPDGDPGLSFTAASAGAGEGTYGRYGKTGIVISTLTNSSIAGDSSPSMSRWIKRLPVHLETPIDWDAYSYEVPVYPGASNLGRGTMSQTQSTMYWYEPANPVEKNGRGVVYETSHLRKGQNLATGAKSLAVLPPNLSGFDLNMVVSKQDVAVLLRAGNRWTVVMAGPHFAVRWTYSAAPGKVPMYLTSVPGGFTFSTTKATYKVTWGSDMAVNVGKPWDSRE